jgi:hypothetical protein
MAGQQPAYSRKLQAFRQLLELADCSGTHFWRTPSSRLSSRWSTGCLTSDLRYFRGQASVALELRSEHAVQLPVQVCYCFIVACRHCVLLRVDFLEAKRFAFESAVRPKTKQCS